MPVRISNRIPKARADEILCFGAAGLTSFVPFYLIIPGAEECLASQTTLWAPRWERNITFFNSPAERGIQRVRPPVEKAFLRIDSGLPLERMAKNMDRRIGNAMTRLNGNGHH